ncbi:enamine deaminase RidA [Burkholderia sp. SG-MS1]|uniref:RidA family protein n=1 Tax=Paraburkholderia sp. SG-MS1 TaxID=2023741 RepID=UPI001580A9C5|nr:RidA family protein [Paraburkholderia sp. SG-MS1]NKJ49233.1 enamine deaminase RidA [Paraburkholderia sp. SG-MS1]
MACRKSIYLAGFKHKNPIPNACVIDGLLMSGVVLGVDPATGDMPATLEAQCANMFDHVRAIVEAAGGTPADIIKMTVWLRDPSQRQPVNDEWLKLFPDHDDRPARHALPLTAEGPSLVQCDVTAVLPR